MVEEQISIESLKELKNFDTPTISNAIEIFNLRSRIEGFMGPEIKCFLPIKKPIIGYACTVKMSSLNPPKDDQKKLWLSYYESVRNTSNPTIVVVEDIDSPPIGSFWGEVRASIHKALGCVGTITNGGVRDINEVKNLNFAYFAYCLLVSHGYVHIIDYNCPVKVGGIEVKPGDLLHADIHGVINVPKKIVPNLADVCRKIQDSEKPVFKRCRQYFNQGSISKGEIQEALEEMNRRKPKLK